MRILRYIKVTFILIGTLTIYSCSSTNGLTIPITRPAPVYLGSHIENIGILNRSLPSEKNKDLDDLDKILSAEGKNLDKEGAHEVVLGLLEELKKDNRFSTQKIINSEGIDNPALGVFPAPLSWAVLEQISAQNNVDGLFVLSFYDTDAKIQYKAVPVKINALGLSVPAIEHHANLSTTIKVGWRIYDIESRTILDEFVVHENVTASGVGINPAKAAQAILGRKQAVLDISNAMGRRYYGRTLPHRMRVSRDYYVKGTDNFKIGKRRAQTGDWEGAADLWERDIANSKQKIAGRAYYNMAIINEINGDLDAAIDWASKSYTDYKNKDALLYMNVLKNRRIREEQLKQETQ